MTEHTMRLAAFRRKGPSLTVLQLGYLRDDMIRAVQSLILIGRTHFFRWRNNGEYSELQ